MKILLKPGGVITMEFPHLMRLVDDNQWDTIYHEHFSYFSFLTASRVFAAHGLACSTSRSCRRTAARLRIFGGHARRRRHAGHRAGRASFVVRERAAGFERPRDLHGLRRVAAVPTTRSCGF